MKDGQDLTRMQHIAKCRNALLSLEAALGELQAYEEGPDGDPKNVNDVAFYVRSVEGMHAAMLRDLRQARHEGRVGDITTMEGDK